jgi:sterol O-acyltransferase
MASSTDIHMNRNGDANHDHILRPRAVKPPNPAVLRAMSDDKLFVATGNKEFSETGTSTGQTRYYPSGIALDVANGVSGRSTPVPADAPPSAHSISSARKQLRAEQRRRLFPTIEYASRVSHFDPNSDYRDFQGFYILFWIALTIMAVTTMLRNVKDTGYPMRVQIWQLFTVKVWELALADALMVGTTAISLPLHRLFRNKTLRLRWKGMGMVIQSIYQTFWFAFWVT